MKWEYQVVCSDVQEEGVDQFEFEDWPNKQGAQGWELVGTNCVARNLPGLTVPLYQLLITFKRPAGD